MPDIPKLDSARLFEFSELQSQEYVTRLGPEMILTYVYVYEREVLSTDFVSFYLIFNFICAQLELIFWRHQLQDLRTRTKNRTRRHADWHSWYAENGVKIAIFTTVVCLKLLVYQFLFFKYSKCYLCRRKRLNELSMLVHKVSQVILFTLKNLFFCIKLILLLI